MKPALIGAGNIRALRVKPTRGKHIRMPKEEQAFILNAIETCTVQEIGHVLDRPAQSIRTWLNRLGVSTAKQNKPWTRKEEKILAELWLAGVKGPEMSKVLNRSTRSIYSRITYMRHCGRWPEKY